MLIACPACKGKVSKRAEVCPQCNYPLMQECIICRTKIPIDGKCCHHCGDPDPFGTFKKDGENAQTIVFDNSDTSAISGDKPEVQIVTCPICDGYFSERAAVCQQCKNKTSQPCQICSKKISILVKLCPECGDPSPFDFSKLIDIINDEREYDNMSKENDKSTYSKIETIKNKTFKNIAQNLGIPLDYYLNKKIRSEANGHMFSQSNRENTRDELTFYELIISLIKRRKPLSAPPNLLFISYFIISYIILNYSKWPPAFDLTLLKSVANNFLMTLLPLTFVIIYNCSAGKVKAWAIASNTITIIFTILTFKIYYFN